MRRRRCKERYRMLPCRLSRGVRTKKTELRRHDQDGEPMSALMHTSDLTRISSQGPKCANMRHCIQSRMNSIVMRGHEYCHEEVFPVDAALSLKLTECSLKVARQSYPATSHLSSKPLSFSRGRIAVARPLDKIDEIRHSQCFEIIGDCDAADPGAEFWVTILRE